MKKRIQKILAALSFLLLTASILTAQTVSGIITDDTGIGLPGVNVVIKGTSNGTTTDLNGNYSISAEYGTVLVFSFTGFATQEITVAESPTINLEMSTDAQLLEEIVVTGYGQTQNKRLVSTSVSTLPAKILEERPIARVEQAIQGSAPAVVVIQESGSPGAPMTIRMRGVGTAGNATPLILINGVQVPSMDFVNGNEIQNITILKDAAAGAIYGARGGNGVILVETKSGKANFDKPNVTLSSYYGIQSLASEGNYMNAQEYAEYYNNSVNYLIRQGQQVNGRNRFSDEEIALLPNDSWISRVSDAAPIRDIHLGLSGGNKNTQGYLGVGTFDQQGIIGNTAFNRLSLSGDLTSRLGNKVDLRITASMNRITRDFIPENSENSRLISSVTSLPPVLPAYTESGDPFNVGNRRGISFNGVPLNVQPEFGNPLVGLLHGENRATGSSFFGNALLNYQIIDKLKISASAGTWGGSAVTENFSQKFSYPDQFMENPNSYFAENTTNLQYLQGESYLTYNALDNSVHNLDLIAGTSVLENSFDIEGQNVLNPLGNTLDDASFDNIDAGSVINTFDGAAEKNTTVSFFGKANYNLSEKYLFTASLRADASSKFGDDNKWGYFPAFSAGWVVSSEDFLKESSVFDLLKLRASWGINGSDQIPAYQHISRYILEAGSPVAQDFNPAIKWEEISQTNVGVDANLFGNRVGVTLDYYVKTTSDMLINFPNPGFLGLPPPFRNAATVKNTGFEAIFLFRNKVGKDFSYDIGLNFGTVRNEVTNLGGGLPIEGAATRVFSGAPNLTRTDIGNSIASFYGYQFDRLDEIGNPIYKDLNNDGVITPGGDRTYIGNPFPDFISGLNLSLKYKNFDLTTYVFASQGNDVVNASLGYHVQYSNRTSKALDAWTLENTNTNVPRPSALEVVNHEFSDLNLEDGSFIRLKNITLGYTLPESLLTKVNISKFRFYASANNIFTITNYSGLDPEIGSNNNPLDVGVDRGFYPLARSITGGLQVSF